MQGIQIIGSGNVPGAFEFGVTEELLVFQGLSGFHVDDSVGTVAVSGKDASSNAVLFGLDGVRRHSATRVAMLSMSVLGATSGLAERLGLVRRGRCVSDEVSGGAGASGDSTISCGGGECASGVT